MVILWGVNSLQAQIIGKTIDKSELPTSKLRGTSLWS